MKPRWHYRKGLEAAAASVEKDILDGEPNPRLCVISQTRLFKDAGLLLY